MKIVDSFKLERAMFWLYIQFVFIGVNLPCTYPRNIKDKNHKNKNQDLKNRKTVFLMREEEFN